MINSKKSIISGFIYHSCPFSFNAELGLGALGNAAVGGEVNLPTWFKPVVMGLGVMSLANTAWTAAQPYLANQAVAEEKRMTELKGLKDQIEKLNKENAALKKGKEQPKEKPQEKPKHLTL